MLLRSLLFELMEASAASAEAKERGLKHVGFGNYATSAGNVVARSEKGKLVPIHGGALSGPQKSAHAEKAIDPTKSALYRTLSHTSLRTHERWHNNGAMAAQQQDRAWKARLPIRTLVRVMQAEIKWQEGSSWRYPRAVRKHLNSLWNRTIGGRPPATIRTTTPIERGMKIPKKDIGQFLKAFTVGKTITLPPSGFSLNPGVARSFMYLPYAKYMDTAGWESRSDEVSVLLRIRPRNQTIIGMNLSNEQVSIKQLKKHGSKNVAAKLIDTDGLRHNQFEGEQEVIRPGNALNQVLGIKRHVFSYKGIQQVVYEIEMEEAGLTNDAKLIKEAQPEETDDDVLFQYLNNSIHQGKKPA